MTARVDVQAVRDILQEPNLGNSQIAACIESANILVNDLLIGQGYSDEKLTVIEKWLAAHLTTNIDPKEQTKSIDQGRANVTYEGDFGQGLNSSRYGQHAMILDTRGILANMGYRRSYVFTVGSSSDY